MCGTSCEKVFNKHCFIALKYDFNLFNPSSSPIFCLACMIFQFVIERKGGYCEIILLPVESSRFCVAMWGCDRQLRIYSREFTTLKGIKKRRFRLSGLSRWDRQIAYKGDRVHIFVCGPEFQSRNKKNTLSHRQEWDSRKLEKWHGVTDKGQFWRVMWTLVLDFNMPRFR